jgi:hypothetical protein
MSADLDTARSAQQHLSEVLSDVSAVNGIGITRVGDGFGLKLNLTDASAEHSVPSEIDGVSVRVVVVGRAFAH